jgi:hypothetical protein
MTNSSRSRTTHIVLIAIGISVLYVIGVLVRQQRGIAVLIRNDSGETLRQVSVKVESIGNRGKNHDLPDLAVGARVRIYVRPLTESHVNLEFSDARGEKHVETVVGYVESGYCGTATTTILLGGRTESRTSVPELMCWKGWLDL